MGFKSAEDDLEEFLSRQPSWLQKILRGDYALSPEERSDLLQSDWPDVFGKARDEYLELLKKCPEKLGEYRKLQKRLAVQSALLNIPSLKPGARRLDAVAFEAGKLKQAGLSQADIALSLNCKYPERKDRKGNKKPFTEESVRKLLKRRRGNTADRM